MKYIFKCNLQDHLQVDVVSSEIQKFAQTHERRLHHHEKGWGHTAPGQHGHSAQIPEKKTFWAGLSDNVKAETVLVQVLV